MKSNKDYSHATNVENFTTFLTYIESLGTRYNPSQDKQKLTYLQTRLTETQTIMDALTKAEQKDLAARDERRNLFDTLPPLVARVLRIFSLCNVSKDTIETVKSIVKKLQGKRLKPLAVPATGAEGEAPEPEPVHNDATKRSFMFMVQHMEHLIATLSTATDYTPNEIDLKITSLQNLVVALKAANQKTYTTDAALEKARLDRNRTLYREGDGVVKLAKGAKSYIAAVFGPHSPESKAANAFKFMDHDFTEVGPISPDPA